MGSRSARAAARPLGGRRAEGRSTSPATCLRPRSGGRTSASARARTMSPVSLVPRAWSAAAAAASRHVDAAQADDRQLVALERPRPLPLGDRRAPPRGRPCQSARLTAARRTRPVHWPGGTVSSWSSGLPDEAARPPRRRATRPAGARARASGQPRRLAACSCATRAPARHSTSASCQRPSWKRMSAALPRRNAPYVRRQAARGRVARGSALTTASASSRRESRSSRVVWLAATRMRSSSRPARRAMTAASSSRPGRRRGRRGRRRPPRACRWRGRARQGSPRRAAAASRPSASAASRDRGALLESAGDHEVLGQRRLGTGTDAAGPVGHDAERPLHRLDARRRARRQPTGSGRARRTSAPRASRVAASRPPALGATPREWRGSRWPAAAAPRRGGTGPPRRDDAAAPASSAARSSGVTSLDAPAARGPPRSGPGRSRPGRARGPSGGADVRVAGVRGRPARDQCHAASAGAATDWRASAAWRPAAPACSSRASTASANSSWAIATRSSTSTTRPLSSAASSAWMRQPAVGRLDRAGASPLERHARGGEEPDDARGVARQGLEAGAARARRRGPTGARPRASRRSTPASSATSGLPRAPSTTRRHEVGTRSVRRTRPRRAARSPRASAAASADGDRAGSAAKRSARRGPGGGGGARRAGS